MTLKYNVTGAKRKELVNAISEITETPAKYLGAPTFAYEAGYFTIDKNGGVTFNDRADSEEIETLIERLCEQGFEAECNVPDETRLSIAMPRDLFTDAALGNLDAILNAKGNLIRKALGVNELPVLKGNNEVSFPWFKGQPSADEVKAYEHFVCALCDMARNQKRVTATEKETDNEKYAFRCFLLRLGFIGVEYKQERKILLSRLTGSSAFKSDTNSEVSESE